MGLRLAESLWGRVGIIHFKPTMEQSLRQCKVSLSFWPAKPRLGKTLVMLFKPL